MPPPRWATRPTLIRPLTRMTRAVREGRRICPLSDGAGVSQLLYFIGAVASVRQYVVGVLAQHRRAALRVERRRRHLDRRAERAQRPSVGWSTSTVISRAMACGVVERLLVIEDRPARDAGLFELAEPVRAPVASTVTASISAASSSRCATRWWFARKPRVGQPFGVAEHARELGEVAIVGGADRDVAVGAAECLIRRGHADAPIRAGRAPAPVEKYIGGLPHRQRQAGIDQRRVDVLARGRCSRDGAARRGCR